MEQEKDTTLQHIAENTLKNSIVRLNVERETPCDPYRTSISKIETTNGTGFFIDKHLIVTNFHVIVGAASITIKLTGKEELYQIESVEAYDDKNDLILLKVNYEGIPLKLGDSDTIHDEDEICAVSYLNDHAKIEHATIQSIWKRPSGDLICLTTKSTGGSSGSPILNCKGEAIGVKESSRIDKAGNVVCGYAIPSNRLKKLLQDRTESVPFEAWRELPMVRYLAEIDAADKFRKDGHYKAAIAHYDFAIELNPETVDVYQERADAKMELGLMEEGIADLLTAYRFKSVPFSLSNLKEYLSWKWGEILLIGLRLFVKLFKTFLGQRILFVGQGNSKIREAKSESELGNNAKARRLYQEAINLFTEAINLDPKTAVTYNNRGWTKYLMGQLETEQGNTAEAEKIYQETVDDVNSGLRLKPKLARIQAACYHTRGAAKAALGEHQEAIEDFNKSIRLRPKKALYYHDCGLSKEALGQHEAAKIDFAKAKELDPKIKK